MYCIRFWVSVTLEVENFAIYRGIEEIKLRERECVCVHCTAGN